jgi:hypothetical protein
MKQFLIAIGLVGALTAALVVWAMRDAAADSKRQTAEATAVGFVATPVTFWDGDDQQEGHTLTYAWVDGANAVHTETQREITWYDSARTYKVCYNPQDPSDRRLYSSDHVCGS